MKVLENRYNAKEVKEEKIPDVLIIHCNECDSELEITENDTHIGWLGARFITCPCCGEESMVDELEGITLTKDNLEFPVHFNRTMSGLRNVIEIGANKIIKEIQDAIMFLRAHKDMDYKYVSYGDLFVIVFRYEGDENYFVLVTKDFYEVDIPFEKEDYE